MRSSTSSDEKPFTPPPSSERSRSALRDEDDMMNLTINDHIQALYSKAERDANDKHRNRLRFLNVGWPQVSDPA